MVTCYIFFQLVNPRLSKSFTNHSRQCRRKTKYQRGEPLAQDFSYSPESDGKLQMSTRDPWGPTLSGRAFSPGPPRLQAFSQKAREANRLVLPWQPPERKVNIEYQHCKENYFQVMCLLALGVTSICY